MSDEFEVKVVLVYSVGVLKPPTGVVLLDIYIRSSNNKTDNTNNRVFHFVDNDIVFKEKYSDRVEHFESKSYQE